ncbi:MAG: RNA polymerase sigma factor [Clostridia bacterium]|nr:RNA polymerase sigma factor [Clostridia bacterium]
MADFERVFEENRGLVYRFLLKMCKDSFLAEELTQETFYRAYINLASLKKEEKVSLWLCSIAKNTYFAHINREKKTASFEEADLADEGFDVEKSFEEKELSQKALRALHTLAEPYKEVFMLSVFAGLSFKDISTLFGKSESWARVTFYRAKLKLAEEMR